MKKVFIFDLDDTLYWNVHDYCYPVLEFEKFLLDLLGHKAPQITAFRKLEKETALKLVHEINPSTGQEFGYSIDRFPKTLVETYRVICFQEGLSFDQKVADKIWQIGMKAFDPELYRKKGLVEGVEEVLDFLKNKGDELILLTRGDKSVQQLKIDNLKLARWFYHIHIVAFKDIAIFNAMARAFRGVKSIYSVGNSLESDIKPAVEAGLLGIYIPYDTWEFKENTEEILSGIDKSQLFIFKEIIEIKNKYKEL
jgi:putative hydrolase of the HAD superfamily